MDTHVILGATLDKLKEKATNLKKEIIQVMIENIQDQNRIDSVAGMFSCFDLSTDESKEERLHKLGKLHDIYGHTMFHTLEEKW